MRIGINATNTRTGGGQFQFLLMVLDALMVTSAEYEIYLFYFSGESNLSQRYRKTNWHWIDLAKKCNPRPFNNAILKSAIRKSLDYLGITVRKNKKNRIIKHEEMALGKIISGYGLDFIIFPTWTEQCWEWGVPFIFAVHDLQHLIQPEFCEVSLGNRWSNREAFFRTAISKAKIVLVDSEEGKKNVLQFYDCDPEKVNVLPYTLSSYCQLKISEEKRSEIMRRLRIPQKFFFYPAQFWPHKNHYRVIEAMGLIKKIRKTLIPLVLTGRAYPEWDVLNMCKALAKKYSVENQIYYLGHVSDEELIALYKTAVGLAMPTYFGPTNIPYLEAFYHSCPVITSDIPGIREQMGDAALLVDPKNSNAIAEGMYSIWTDNALRENLIKNGKERLKEFLPERFAEKIGLIIGNLSGK